eukprot:1179725-Prorocentrum_minimum.AAC.4
MAGADDPSRAQLLRQTTLLSAYSGDITEAWCAWWSIISSSRMLLSAGETGEITSRKRSTSPLGA